MPADIQRPNDSKAVEIDKDRYNNVIRDRERVKQDPDLLLNSNGVTLPPAKQPPPLPENRELKIFFNMKGA